jgi:DNA primase
MLWSALRRSGSSRFQGLCPFHADRTPSFFVDVNRQRFVCYGCHVWGDVLDFVRLHEHLGTVGEACAWLTGTPQPTPRRKPSVVASSTQRERRWDRLTLQEQLVMNAAGTLYRDALWRNPTALEYVRGRGVPDWVMRSCGLGYADGRSLEAYLRKQGGLRVAEALGCFVDRSLAKTADHCGSVSPVVWSSPRSVAASPSGSSAGARVSRVGSSTSLERAGGV